MASSADGSYILGFQTNRESTSICETTSRLKGLSLGFKISIIESVEINANWLAKI
jgi:hypothetical protein